MMGTHLARREHLLDSALADALPTQLVLQLGQLRAQSYAQSTGQHTPVHMAAASLPGTISAVSALPTGAVAGLSAQTITRFGLVRAGAPVHANPKAALCRMFHCLLAHAHRVWEDNCLGRARSGPFTQARTCSGV